MNNELLLTLALMYAEGIGDITARKLIAHFGSCEQLFSEAKRPGSAHITPALRRSITCPSIISQAEDELNFCLKNDIEPLLITQPEYPYRLKECADAPLILFRKGNASLSTRRMISIVGTRRSTEYGKELVDELVSDLASYNVVIISGLAFGIDINAHKASLRCGLSTIAVVAHGLDRIYPGQHRSQVLEMLEHNGAMVSDFPSGTKPDKENFPKRNRIIAGLADAVVVVEAREKGGALITADIANSYSREVFAFPGKVSDIASAGCLKLIKNNQAALISGSQDLIKAMRWDESKKDNAVQPSLFTELTQDEQLIVNLVKTVEMADIDFLSMKSGWNTGKVATTLLNLEFSGVLKALPGKVYKMNR